MNLLELPSPLWVLGTDTHVGKTHVAALIARAWAADGPVTYRKPFQTGVLDSEDPEADAPHVRGAGIRVETGLCLAAPLSPMAAAEAEGRPLDLAALEALAAWTVRPPEGGGRLLLEAAGGVLVPLCPGRHFLAWATDLRMPHIGKGGTAHALRSHVLQSVEAPREVWAEPSRPACVLVARGGLGTLNHTLLSAEALMLRGWILAAVLLNPGVDGSQDAAPGNARLLSRFLPVPVRVLEAP